MYKKDITEVLGIQGFFVKKVEIEEKRLFIEIGREKEIYYCSRCGQESFICHDKRMQIIRDLDMSGKRTYLKLERCRLECDCDKSGREKVIVEGLEFIDINRRMTKRFEAYVYVLTTKMTIKDVSEVTKIDWHTIRDIEKRYIKKLRHKVRWDKIKRLAVDEVSWNGRREYITIVTDRDGQGVVWIGDGRSEETLNKFFKYVGEKHYKKFTLFTADMNKGYTASIKEHCPKADIVYDLFHIMRLFNEEINKVRANDMQKGREEGKKYYRNDKWLILKSQENLTIGEEIDLKKLLDENQNTHKSCILRESFREILRERTQTTETLTERLKKWVEEAWDTGLKPIQSFCRTVIRHFEGIVNYFRYHVTNSIAEGINNVIKRLQRLAYGYRNKEYFKLKIIQQCSTIDNLAL